MIGSPGFPAALCVARWGVDAARSLTRVVCCAALAVCAATPPAQAHTPVTTRYRFYTDVKPVLQKHCVRCHSPGGPTPMSLQSYAETRPWAESLKEQVLGRRMPPFFVEHGGVALANGSPLSASELDVLVDWASGGAPEGARPQRGATSAARRDEPHGGADGTPPPDGGSLWRVFDWDAVTVARPEKERSVTHPVQLGGEVPVFLSGWAVDGEDLEALRSAVIWLERPASEANVFLGSWVHGEPAFLFPEGTALELPPRASVRIDARYKRTWRQRSLEVVVRARLRLRLASRPPVSLVMCARLGQRPGEGSLPPAAMPLALFPESAGRLLLGTDTDESGTRTVIDLYRAPPAWPVTYRFAAPGTLAGRLVWEAAGGGSRGAAVAAPVAHILYVVP